MHRSRAGLILLALPLAGGCARIDQADIPSLMPRPIEARGPEITTPPPAPPPPADAALASRLSALRSDLDAARRQFDRAEPAAARAVRRAANVAPAGESWIEAQAALTGLDGAQAPAAAVLGSVEALLADRVVAGNPAGRREIETLLADAERVVAAQLDRLRGLRGTLRD